VRLFNPETGQEIVKLQLDKSQLQRLQSINNGSSINQFPNALIFCQLVRAGADCWSFVSVCKPAVGRTVIDMNTRLWDATAWREQHPDKVASSDSHDEE